MGEEEPEASGGHPRGDPGKFRLVGCPVCGRSFSEDRVETHAKICAESSSRQRDVYDIVRHRITGTEAGDLFEAGELGPVHTGTERCGDPFQTPHPLRREDPAEPSQGQPEEVGAAPEGPADAVRDRPAAAGSAGRGGPPGRQPEGALRRRLPGRLRQGRARQPRGPEKQQVTGTASTAEAVL